MTLAPPLDTSLECATRLLRLPAGRHVMALQGEAPGQRAPGFPAPCMQVSVPPGSAAAILGQAGGSMAWLVNPGDAVTVAVPGPASPVLVTTYRAAGSGPSTLALAVRPFVAPLPSGMEVLAHVSRRGDVRGREGDWVGDPTGQCWVEGLALIAPGTAGVEYRVLGAEGEGDWHANGHFAGSRGRSRPLLGLAVRAPAGSPALAVEAVFASGHRAGPANDGSLLRSPRQGDPLVAFRVRPETLPA